MQEPHRPGSRPAPDLSGQLPFPGAANRAVSSGRKRRSPLSGPADRSHRCRPSGQGRGLVAVTDRISAARRSWNMSRIRGKDTGPEIRLRKLLHRAGYRFRLHAPHLPGKPDIVLPKYRSAIFVHGCFWHRHQGCPLAAVPKTRPDFWSAKFEGTIERDRRKTQQLEALGWRVITVWQCELESDADQLLASVRSLLPRLEKIK